VPSGGEAATFFVCLYVASPFDPLRTEKTADFGVESRDPTANLCPSSKIPDFLRVGGGGIERGDFRDFGGGCFVGRLQPTQNTRFARKMHGLLAEMS